MKKIVTLFLALLLIGGVQVPHTHDEQCGYNPDTKSGCIYEIDKLELKNPWS